MTAAQLAAGAGVVLALEGLAYACFPAQMRRVIAAVAAAPETVLRRAGLLAAILGVGLAWVLT